MILQRKALPAQGRAGAAPVAPFDPKALLASLPGLPGVYRMMGPEGEALYVGKAGDLKKRVSSYFQKSDHGPRIDMMLSQVASVEITVTRSEGEALILENNLIKSLNPRYNILFRDDKSYPYLMVSGDEFPRLGFHRGAMNKPHRYYGPFPHAGAVRESIQLLQRVFRLRTCEDSVFRNRSRPCLLYQIRRCTAPCVGLISAAAYAEDVKGAQLYLEGRSDAALDRLETRMQGASDARRYEEAAVFRDQIRSLAKVSQRQYADTGADVDLDVIAVVVDQGTACVNLMMVRGGLQLGDRSLFPQNAEERDAREVLAAFVAQHYLERSVPPLIVVGEDLGSTGLEGSLREHAGHEVRIVSRPTAERRAWLEMARENARLALKARLAERTTQGTRLAALHEVLGLPEGVQRIECFDISHTMGEATVAACVVYDRMDMRRGEYRRYNIEGLAPGDDYGALNQALARRYGRIAAGEGVQRIECFDISHTMGEATVAACVVYDRMDMRRGEYRRYNIEGLAPGDDYGALNQALARRYGRIAAGEGVAPDAIFIDGGKGQVAAAREALAEVGLSDIALVGIAKGPERKPGLEEIWIGGRSLRIPADNPGLHLMQRIRDEAHRFAIAGHRARRSKQRTTSTLEGISGVGTKRRKQLLTRFGGLKGVMGASVEDLTQVEGISRKLAEKIYQELHAV